MPSKTEGINRYFITSEGARLKKNFCGQGGCIFAFIHTWSDCFEQRIQFGQGLLG